jgi:phosphoglycerate dehydrogenase-like enzyme
MPKTNMLILQSVFSFQDEAFSTLQRSFPNMEIRLRTKDSPATEDDYRWAHVIAGKPSPEGLDAAENLKWLHLFSAGVDGGWEIIERLPREILVSKGKGAYDIAIAEHLLAMALSLLRSIKPAIEHMRTHEWGGLPQGSDFYGSTVGVIGMGSIGDRFAQISYALGARVLGWKRTEREAPEYVERITYGDAGLDLILPECDIVAVCLPGTPHTRGLFDRARIARIKKGALILNIGRGYTIDSDALVTALREGHLSGAGLDVTDPEPLPEDSPLWDIPNVIITPHMSGTSPNRALRQIESFIENVKAYLNGDPLPAQVYRDFGY